LRDLEGCHTSMGQQEKVYFAQLGRNDGSKYVISPARAQREKSECEEKPGGQLHYKRVVAARKGTVLKLTP
jgi:hypothetical protein